MVPEMVGVLNVFPEARLFPPVGLSHQYTVPLPDVAPKTTEPVPHREPAVVEVKVGLLFTVIVPVALTVPHPPVKGMV